jgi:hypothetical protein
MEGMAASDDPPTESSGFRAWATDDERTSAREMFRARYAAFQDDWPPERWSEFRARYGREAEAGDRAAG